MGRKRITRKADWNTTTGAWNTPSEKRYLLDGMDVVQERDDQNAVTTVYVRAGNIGGLLSKSKRVAGQNDVHLYFHYDGQGNVVQLTGATQATVATYSYDAFGNDRGTSGAEAAGNLYRFSTKEFQAYSGLYDYGLRFYSPSMGRFINRDPSGIAGGLNLYAAFANNPLSNVDDYGLSASSLLAAFGRGVWDGLIGGGLTVVQAYAESAAVTFLMGSCSPCVPAITAAIGVVGTAVGMAGLVEAVAGILNSDLCPDEKAYQMGLIVGGMLAGMLGGALGNKFGPQNGGCFVAGTLVTMADGSQKKIEEVKEGEMVMARDEATGKTEARRVEHKSVKYVEATRILSFSDGSKIETTDEHPFYIESRGFLPAKEAGIGTSIVTRAGPSLQVTKVEVKKQGATVYNFTVEGLHTYFVGGDSFWVHNAANCRANGGSGTHDDPVEVELNRNRYPESADHIEEAQAAGHDDLLEINRSGADANRADSLRDVEPIPSMDRDEYPFAMTTQGGNGASVKGVNPSDNRGAGSSMGHALRPYPDGTWFRMILGRW